MNIFSCCLALTAASHLSSIVKYQLRKVRLLSESVAFSGIKLSLDSHTGLLFASSSRNALCFIIRHDNSQVCPPSTFMVVEDIPLAPFQIHGLQLQSDDLIFLVLPKDRNLQVLQMAKRDLYGSLFYPADLKSGAELAERLKAMIQGYPALTECSIMVMKVGRLPSNNIIDISTVELAQQNGELQKYIQLLLVGIILIWVIYAADDSMVDQANHNLMIRMFGQPYDPNGPFHRFIWSHAPLPLRELVRHSILLIPWSIIVILVVGLL